MWEALRTRFTASRPFGLPPLHITVGLLVIGLAATFNFATQLLSFHKQGKYSDFQEFYVAAQLGLAQGWAKLYDRHVYVPALVHAGGLHDAFVTTLLQAWVSLPFIAFPLWLAFILWWLVLVALFVISWRLVVRGGLRYRVVLLLAAFGTEPSWFLLLIGQIFPFVFASLAATYWALMRRRQVLAGIALVGILFKPQDAILVPVALLVVGRFKTVGVFALIASVFAVLSFSLIGGLEGLAHWRDSLNYDLAKPFVRQYSLPEHLPSLLVWPSRLVITGAVALAAWRHRSAGVAVPISAAVLGSMLISPYLNPEDLQMLVLCAWLTLPTTTRLGKAGLMLTFAVAMTETTFRPLPLLVIQVVWLSSLATGWTVRLEAWAQPMLHRVRDLAPVLPRPQPAEA